MAAQVSCRRWGLSMYKMKHRERQPRDNAELERYGSTRFHDQTTHELFLGGSKPPPRRLTTFSHPLRPFITRHFMQLL